MFGFFWRMRQRRKLTESINKIERSIQRADRFNRDMLAKPSVRENSFLLEYMRVSDQRPAMRRLQEQLRFLRDGPQSPLSVAPPPPVPRDPRTFPGV